MRIKLLSLFCGAVLGLSFSAAADVNGDMNNFFNKLGFASNTSQPQVWQGQAAGYASGGSLYARTQVKTIQLVSMTSLILMPAAEGLMPIWGHSPLSTASSCRGSQNKS